MSHHEVRAIALGVLVTACAISAKKTSDVRRAYANENKFREPFDVEEYSMRYNR